MNQATNVRSAVDAVLAVSEAIRELGEVPSGVLYAQLVGHVSLDQFKAIVGILTRAGLVRESGHVLRWIGPQLAGG